MTDVCMMFAFIQPPCKGDRPFEKDYYKMTKMCITSLIQTGFNASRILCVTAEEYHANKLSRKFGIMTRVCPDIPPEFRRSVKKNPMNYFFFKPIAYFHMVPKSLSENTVMAFCDVDALFKRNPDKLLMEPENDIWALRGTSMPRVPKDPTIRAKYKRQSKPRMIYKDLKRFYRLFGEGAMAHLQLIYKYPLPKLALFSGMVAIKPHIYSKLISTWYEMSCIIAQRDDLNEGGDQETLSAAAWHLGLSMGRGRKAVKGYCKQYASGRKSEMIKDYKKFRPIIKRRRLRRQRQEEQVK
ncbi:hypothetical protein LCGC14_0768990 [marine sediment metagenome]|uniref:Nucleotide-diphospho-sugar transferase domain-containing protein n=1 Tax=marine sediment metagenome TaxID=412755 RepID=A0A0F9Q322_9ZZZZ